MIRSSMIRPFLKWPGGKYRLIDKINTALPLGKELIEPFVGSGAVFLNTHCEKYLLNDANNDLITLFRLLQQEGNVFIQYCREFFIQKNNKERQYYRFRKAFNACQDPAERSALFLYLNRHGYNGLCRYNACRNEFNVPFGRYHKPYFPEEEMQAFYEKSKHVVFLCEDFSDTLMRAKKGSVVYCDPPYVALNKTSNFTTYRSGGFMMAEQHKLVALSEALSKKGIPVLISNHSNEVTQNLYRNAELSEFKVQRFISCLATERKQVIELLAYYPAKK